MKACKECGDPKALKEFRITSHVRADGTQKLSDKCKSCENIIKQRGIAERKEAEKLRKEKEREKIQTLLCEPWR